MLHAAANDSGDVVTYLQKLWKRYEMAVGGFYDFEQLWSGKG